MVERLDKISFLKKVDNIPKIDFNEILNKQAPIIFDTNFLFITFEFKIDIIEQIKNLLGNNYSFFIYEGTLKELEKIEQSKSKNKKYLGLIAKMLQIYNFKIIKSSELYVDREILSNLNDKVLIGTNDKNLRQEIKQRGFKVLYLRQLSFLEIK